ncbi:hypothetical protein [Pseudomonas citronellolis]|uniref:hypothetical protein n=1 Tax=Pseudomonas citronellolis TaxID=53408 RepID=UPI000B1B8797|nr:hypothetical protein [Pseudomonas citronellolis]
MKSSKTISIAIFLTAFISASTTNLIAGEKLHFYDLRDNCNFSISIKMKLQTKPNSCTLSYFNAMDSPFFNGYVLSQEGKPSKLKPLGQFKTKNGNLVSARENYYDDERNVEQKIIKREEIDSLKKSNSDIVIATLLEITYDKEIPTTQEIVSTDEFYECWDGVFHGATRNVIVSLCSLTDPKSKKLFSLDNWKAQAIKSINIY